MLARLAHLGIHRPRRMALLTLLVFVLAAAFGGPATTSLQVDRAFDDPGSESAQARHTIEDRTKAALEPGVIAVVAAPPGSPEVKRAAATLRDDPDVARVDLPRPSDRASPLVARDGESTLVAATLRTGIDTEKTVERLEDDFASQSEVELGGPAVSFAQVNRQAAEDLTRGELMAFPILIVLALLFFRGVAAAILPLAIGILSVLITFALLRVVNVAVDLSPFALNLVIGLGLGLAIDYSLFLVSRFREEMGQGHEPPEAVRRTMATAGRTVIFSSLTVAAALACLCVFPLPFLVSMGIGGLLVSLVAGATALTVLPGLFILLGARLGRVKPQPEGEGRWYATAQAVMRRPGIFAALALIIMLVLAAPSLRTQWAGVDATILPTSKSARVVSDTLVRDFPGVKANPIVVAVKAPEDAARQLAAYADRLRDVPNVASVTPPRLVGPSLWQVDAGVRGSPISAEALATVEAVRAVPTSFPVQVGGDIAALHDQRTAVSEMLPLSMVLLVLTTLIILWLMTGSVILPLKALFMNLLTTAAAAGMLVFIFQDGRFESFLGYRSQGGIEQTDFLVMVAIVFGLSTDYGVFLLTRIKEARDRNPAHPLSDREAIAVGIQRTGGIVTAAAILLAVALGAFLTSRVVFLQELGAGAAFAVLLDAFIIRTLLVPSLMAMMGRWNWWSPAPLRRLHAKIGINEGPVLPPATVTAASGSGQAADQTG